MFATFDGLAVAAARKHGASVLLRGVRDGTDFDYEMQLAGMNAGLDDNIQTVFIPATAQTRHISATLVRQIARMGGDISPYIPADSLDAVMQAMAQAEDNR